jgi:hypothetical protein
MRVFIILPFYLIIILANLQRTTSEDCKCECCTSENCRPTTVGIHSLWFCSETTTCKQTSCITWHSDQCPPQGTFGQTRAICVSTSNTERVLPSLFMILLLLIYLFY